MILARGTNLHGTSPYPDQGLWIVRADAPSADRADWSTPVRILDTEAPGTPSWMGRGVCGPTVISLPDGCRRVYITGTHAVDTWRAAARLRLRRARRLPVPAPYFLATGWVDLNV